MKKTKRVLGSKLLSAPIGKVEEAATSQLRTEVSVRAAKDQLSSLLQRAAGGEEIVITSDGEPKAMLVRHKPMLEGKPWQPLAKFRATMPMTPDSTPLVEAARGDIRDVS